MPLSSRLRRIIPTTAEPLITPPLKKFSTLSREGGGRARAIETASASRLIDLHRGTESGILV